MTRWEFITCDEYITATLEFIITSKRPVKETRKDAARFMIKLRDELLHGDQGNGCSDKECKICYTRIKKLGKILDGHAKNPKKLENGREKR